VENLNEEKKLNNNFFLNKLNNKLKKNKNKEKNVEKTNNETAATEAVRGWERSTNAVGAGAELAGVEVEALGL